MERRRGGRGGGTICSESEDESSDLVRSGAWSAGERPAANEAALDSWSKRNLVEQKNKHETASTTIIASTQCCHDEVLFQHKQMPMESSCDITNDNNIPSQCVPQFKRDSLVCSSVHPYKPGTASTATSNFNEEKGPKLSCSSYLVMVPGNGRLTAVCGVVNLQFAQSCSFHSLL